MISIKNILYATDFSSHSNQAYFHAVALAEGHGASLLDGRFHVFVQVEGHRAFQRVGESIGSLADQEGVAYARK